MMLSHRQILGLIHEWRKKEEILWWQRARLDYLKYGDANIIWFHSMDSMRRAKNTILGLQDSEGAIQTSSEGVIQTSSEGMTDVVTQFLGHLFTPSQPHSFEEVLKCVTPHVIESMNNSLCAPYTREEVDRALKQMLPHKAPDPNDMNPFFFQNFGTPLVMMSLQLLSQSSMDTPFPLS